MDRDLPVTGRTGHVSASGAVVMTRTMRVCLSLVVEESATLCHPAESEFA